jgi:ATP-dependent DNA helicase RecG
MTSLGDAGQNPLRETAQYVKGVGPHRFALLQKLGVETVGDLLFYFPRTYEDLSNRKAVAELQADGSLQTVFGEIVELDSRTTASGKTLLSVVISDGHGGVLEGVWFNQAYLARQLRYGLPVALTGKPEWRFEHWQMNNPRLRALDDNSAEVAQEGLLPIYPLTDGLHADALRRIQKHVLERYSDLVPEVIPGEIRERLHLLGIGAALRQMHFPRSGRQAEAARRRLVFEEFLVLHVALALRRRDVRDAATAPALPVTEVIDARIRRLFPFALTRDQNRAIVQICRDMGQTRPMKRLLQADVGAGKTAVAVYAMLLAVANKHQVALMAPTEVLARQHWRTVNQYLAESRVKRRLLTGSLPDRERRVALGELRMGQVDLVVGTQALIQKDVEFARLGLVVIDEQHRFGVAQRAQFKNLGESPHYLVMTATPIPRTIALTVFSDLDVTTMHELPPGRRPVVTKWVTGKQRDKVNAYLVQEVKAGRQLYVVCPLIEDSELAGIRAAEATFRELQTGVFRSFRCGLLHGKLDDNVKEAVMNQFRSRELDVLVATTVIEVGVDVPNATLMVIEHADRFGLSQLHQLRGRVSRGPCAGECFLFADDVSEETKARLRVFVKTTDGFTLAEHDLEQRGMGQFFGTRQHGLSEIRLGNLVRDGELLTLARTEALALVQRDPNLSRPEHQELRKQVLAKYGQTLELAEIG